MVVVATVVVLATSNTIRDKEAKTHFIVIYNHKKDVYFQRKGDPDLWFQ